MPVNDARVQSIPKNALFGAKGSTIADRIDSAWQSVSNDRQGHCDDDDFTAADHYMTARSLVAHGGPGYYSLMLAMINGYNLIKIVGLKRLIPRTGLCEVSSASAEDAAWAMTGALDGLNDFGQSWMIPSRLAGSAPLKQPPPAPTPFMARLVAQLTPLAGTL